MPRQYHWWDYTDASLTMPVSGAADVLAGSGLAVPGATVMRSTGRWQISMKRDNALQVSYLKYGLRIATTANGNDIEDDTINSFEWLWVRLVPLAEVYSPTSGRVGLDGRTIGADWDSDTARVLGEGESLWLVWEMRVVGSGPAVAWSRNLVLSPGP